MKHGLLGDWNQVLRIICFPTQLQNTVYKGKSCVHNVFSIASSAVLTPNVSILLQELVNYMLSWKVSWYKYSGKDLAPWNINV